MTALIGKIATVSAVELAARVELHHPPLAGRAQEEMPDSVIDRDRGKRHVFPYGFVVVVAPVERYSVISDDIA